MDKSTFLYKRDNPKRLAVVELVIATIRELAANDSEFQITLADIKRTLDQNAAMWPALSDFARQVPWPHTVKGEWTIALMRPESWKAVLTAAFEQQTEMAQAIGGGSVMVGARTSQYSKRKMADFLTFVRAEGTERGVKWSEKAEAKFDEYAPRERRAA